MQETKEPNLNTSKMSTLNPMEPRGEIHFYDSKSLNNAKDFEYLDIG